ncbi:MAG: outer membrane beta-barrel protein [Alphaproteobacteria bacterium]|nr:outer membrane beta-barrel protein [Alphaproteobacteria bacterium]
MIAAAACLFASDASALDLKPYLSVNAKFISMDARVKGIGVDPFKVSLKDNVPGAGAGIGGSHVKIGQKSKDTAAYNVGAGINYAFNDHVILDLGRRFVNYTSFDEEIKAPGYYKKIEYNVNAFELKLGLRFSF